ncbi:MAG: hypothetical protein ACPIA7_00515 [Akkermansiaceae bacterium]
MPDQEHTTKSADHRKHKSHNKRSYKPSCDSRARSVPYKKKFIVAVLATLVFYLCVAALITAVVVFFYADPELKKRAAEILVACLGACIFSWLIAYMRRRSTLCPLCKSTPYLDNLAHKHGKAYRIKPLNHGTTAILTTTFFQRWRCMYCGTTFDLLKRKKRST